METSQTARPVKGSWAEGNVDGQPRMQKAPGRFQHKLQTLDRIIRFRVQADGYLPEVSESLDAAALPDEPVRLEFRLEKNTGLEHTVVSPTGEPAADARVVTQVRRGNDTPMLMMSNGITRDEPPEYAPTVEIRTDDKGRFELPIHNDPFVCVIIHESGYLELADRELIEQSELTLKPWTAIEGTVFAQGRPAPNVGLSLLFRSISMAFENEEVPHVRYSVSATTDQAGRYHIPFGMPGEWNVTVSHASSDDEGDEAPRWPVPSPPQSSRFTIDVPRQETLTLDIGREGVDVIGRVIVPEGAEIDWSFSGVHFLSEVTRDADGFPRAEKHQVLLSPDGTFRCVNLRPGNYEGAAIAGRPDAPVRFESIGIRKKSYEKSLELTPEMFVGKSTMNPIDIGDIVLEPVDQ